MVPKAGLPAPPADLSSRKLPLTTIKGELYRIHLSARDWRYFGKNKSERFDDPLGKFGVLYCSTKADSAFTEVFLRNLSLMVVDGRDLMERSLSCFTAAPLKCVDLTGAGLRKLSCDNRISTEKPYHTVGMWSQAFYIHPQQPDGIVYRSRHNPRFRCLALFDRCNGDLMEETSNNLMGPALKAWVADQLEKYNLCLA